MSEAQYKRLEAEKKKLEEEVERSLALMSMQEACTSMLKTVKGSETADPFVDHNLGNPYTKQNKTTCALF